MACKYDYQWCRRTPSSICKFCVADLFVEAAKLEAKVERMDAEDRRKGDVIYSLNQQVKPSWLSATSVKRPLEQKIAELEAENERLELRVSDLETHRRTEKPPEPPSTPEQLTTYRASARINPTT
jgi:uncharacterized small protein (DUF1192 family)